jgi:hypothetical protein
MAAPPSAAAAAAGAGGPPSRPAGEATSAAAARDGAVARAGMPPEWWGCSGALAHAFVCTVSRRVIAARCVILRAAHLSTRFNRTLCRWLCRYVRPVKSDIRRAARRGSVTLPKAIDPQIVQRHLSKTGTK